MLVCAAAVVACDGRAPSAPQGRATAEPTRVYLSIAEDASAAASARGVDLAAVVDDAVERVAQRVHIPPTPLYIRARTRGTVRDIGIRGFANPSTGDVTITLDPRHRAFEELEVALPPTIAHELHHAARIVDGPGYGDSLTEALVTEGLADAFRLEVFPGTRRPPSVPEHRLCRWWARARSTGGRSYDHSAWFFGKGDLPKWAGYSLGFAIVRRYLRDRPSVTAADLVGVPSRRVVAGARFCLRDGRDRSV